MEEFEPLGKWIKKHFLMAIAIWLGINILILILLNWFIPVYIP